MRRGYRRIVGLVPGFARLACGHLAPYLGGSRIGTFGWCPVCANSIQGLHGGTGRAGVTAVRHVED